MSRKEPGLAADLLLGHAAELSDSPDGRDQLLSHALAIGARDIREARAPLADFPELLLRAPEEVDLAGDEDPATEEKEAEHLANRLFDDASGLEGRLIALAALQGALWRCPDIPASPRARRVMKASARFILRRIS